jgi:hypothetical protein
MLLFTCEGPRNIDERDVIHVYRGDRVGRYTEATVVAGSTEVSGLMLTPALDALMAKLDDKPLPPIAA